ncbi:MAG: hypothetical protein PVF43_02875 [Candidatus Eiseniibacteriota bacterium]|jgi:hypothetical protein
MTRPAIKARHRVFLGSIAALALACGGSPGDDGTYGSLDEALDAASQLERPVLVEFFTEW